MNTILGLLFLYLALKAIEYIDRIIKEKYKEQ